jgi:hypothetical protein
MQIYFVSNAKKVIFFLILLATAYANSQTENNFFKDISSVKVIAEVNADPECMIAEDAIKNSALYVLSSTPLNKGSQFSPDVIYVSLLVSAAKNSSRLFGCSGTLLVELWRFVDFKGSRNLVTVWNKHSLHMAGNRADLDQDVRNATEKHLKEFVVKWSQQR